MKNLEGYIGDHYTNEDYREGYHNENSPYFLAYWNILCVLVCSMLSHLCEFSHSPLST